jgi:multidrug efflux pump subunit AcrA (membrane-fusion protein)
LFIISIITKQHQARFIRNKPIVSSVSEWQKNGKPVFIKQILKEDVPLFTKLTLVPKDNNVFEGYAPKSIQEKLAAGQNIYTGPDSSDIIGSVSEVSADISLDTGMYYVKAVFEKPIEASNWLVVYVHIGTLRDIIRISDNIIDRQDEKNYVWKVVEGRAVKQEIKTGQHDGYGIVVLEGLRVGDFVVCEGFTDLSDNELVSIKNIDNTGADQ